MKMSYIIGYMIIKDGDEEIKRVDITVNKDINKSSFLDLLCKNIRIIVTGNMSV